MKCSGSSNLHFWVHTKHWNSLTCYLVEAFDVCPRKRHFAGFLSKMVRFADLKDPRLKRSVQSAAAESRDDGAPQFAALLKIQKDEIRITWVLLHLFVQNTTDKKTPCSAPRKARVEAGCHLREPCSGASKFTKFVRQNRKSTPARKVNRRPRSSLVVHLSAEAIQKIWTLGLLFWLFRLTGLQICNVCWFLWQELDLDSRSTCHQILNWSRFSTSRLLIEARVAEMFTLNFGHFVFWFLHPRLVAKNKN